MIQFCRQSVLAEHRVIFARVRYRNNKEHELDELALEGGNKNWFSISKTRATFLESFWTGKELKKAFAMNLTWLNAQY